MTKTTKSRLVACLSATVGLILGFSVSTFYWNSQEESHPLTNAPASVAEVTSVPDASSTTAEESIYQSDSWKLLQTAFFTLSSIENQDYDTLANLVHKEKGVRFTPFSTVNLENDLVLSPQQIKNIPEDTSLHTWGQQAGTGEIISMTISSYFARFVSPLSYSKAPNIATDSVILSGNALENIAEAYPDCRFIDFTFRSIDPELSGQDWSSLKLVFEAGGDGWYLVAVVHSQWTV